MIPGGDCGTMELKCAEDRNPTNRERLLSKKTRLEMQLKSVNAGLEALDANPELEKFIETVARAL